MQAAVDIVGTSPHPANKIAATLAGKNQNGRHFSLSRTNYWPSAIEEKIGRGVRIGNSSGTVHAETACILEAPGPTEGAALFVTDPPCPNCVKNMAEAGIAALYIDHKGFDKDWARRRGDDFETMSMRICQHAGISVYEIRRKEKKLYPILEIPPGYEPPIENPVFLRHCEEPLDANRRGATRQSRLWIESQAGAMTEQYGGEPFSLARAHDTAGQAFIISAQIHPVVGYTSETIEDRKDKYSFFQQPVNRIMMGAAAQNGLAIDPGTLYSSRVPTARELVNMIGAGLDQITIGDMTAARDEFGLKALDQLQNSGVLNVGL